VLKQKNLEQELEREKARSGTTFKELMQSYVKTTASKKSTIGDLNGHHQTISKPQTRLVNTLRPVKWNDINQEINETESENQLIWKQSEKILKAEYGRMIYNASKLNRGLSIVPLYSSSGKLLIIVRLVSCIWKQYTK